jgi:hypothetical protein
MVFPSVETAMSTTLEEGARVLLAVPGRVYDDQDAVPADTGAAHRSRLAAITRTRPTLHILVILLFIDLKFSSLCRYAYIPTKKYFPISFFFFMETKFTFT